MTHEQAIKLIHELVCAEVELMKQMNSRGTVSKRTDLREKAAAVAIFNALTDEHPNAAEILQMIEL